MGKVALKMSDGFFAPLGKKTPGALLYTKDCTNLTRTKEKTLTVPLEGKMLSTPEEYQGADFLRELWPSPCSL